MKSITRKKTKQEFQPRPITHRPGDLISLLMETPYPRLIEVGTDHLFVHGMEKGDFLIVQPHSEIVENYLTVWSIKGDDFLRVGHAYDNFGDVSLITPEIQRRFKLRDAEMVGVVIGFIRKCESKEEIKAVEIKEAKETNPQSEEMTATCGDCGKTQTGSRQFLQGMGWKITRTRTLCVHCW